MRQAEALSVSAGAVVAALVAGGRFGPGPGHPRTTAWYARLRKPDFTPPGLVYGIAWSALGGLLIYSGSRLLMAKPKPGKRTAVALWTANVVGIALWPAVFFGRKDLPGSVATAVGMSAVAAAAAAAAAKVDRKAGVASVPLIGWLAFASILDAEIWRRNRGGGRR
ncbi:TspO/MBR family protein [Acidiphilium acidophilum]|uniref:TspO/MBR family protein n=1 Tax=Acidiphilium acidophilum TaxID=76588 RepID=A0AAW9DUL8_ACIAO|nr:TspO/MBR family protein [Acidiphilium acidophilum]MDX5931850.1 TspO/MBR family protein [Acidiphilium acidophilum]